MSTTNNTSLNQNFFQIPVSLPEIADRFDEELQKRYWAENALAELLPNLEKASTSYELVLAIQSHLKVTQNQIDRLLHVFNLLEERALPTKYELMEALIDAAHASTLLKIGMERDEAIAVACKRIMQHEISVYEKMLGYAKMLKQDVTAEYIRKSIQEEKESQFVFDKLKIKAIYSDS
ncbi:DUF892 family protein [Flavobacterium sp.]|uniref:DUF892 family protein n=1 Tax=Flavobacterium sp. TaxID=239 RepID=UPI0025C02499|nr:DUF892 family protein [Flavobacterium sp.]